MMNNILYLDGAVGDLFFVRQHDTISRSKMARKKKCLDLYLGPYSQILNLKRKFCYNLSNFLKLTKAIQKYRVIQTQRQDNYLLFRPVTTLFITSTCISQVEPLDPQYNIILGLQCINSDFGLNNQYSWSGFTV